MLPYWIWLANRPNVPDGIKRALVDAFSDPQGVYRASREELLSRNISGLTPKVLEALGDRDLGSTDQILADCARLGIGLLPIQDPRYPDRLRAVFDAPVLLYYKGELPEFDRLPTVAVVGTRKPSVYGTQIAARMGAVLAQGGALVVSGLAEGIDAAAMTGALNQGIATVGVLGCGADIVYPRCNQRLFRQTECQGCILTEYAPGTPPLGWHFPRRNRIISGLSCGVVVVEAPERSGALLTASMALEQGRDVFAVPGNVDMPGFVGSNRLLRDGAIAVSTGADVLLEYEGIYPGKLRRDRPAGLELPEQTPKKPVKKGKRETVPEKSVHKPIDKAANRPYSDPVEDMAALSPEERRVYSVMETEKLVDEVIAASGLNPGKALSVLTMLELKGKIRRLPGKRVARR